MYLRERPTYYVKGSERFAAYYTVQARDLEAQGWVKESEAKPEPVKQETKKAESAPEPTRAELLKSLKEQGVDVPSNATKAELVELSKSSASNG